jgi:hypothetical protein
MGLDEGISAIGSIGLIGLLGDVIGIAGSITKKD